MTVTARAALGTEWSTLQWLGPELVKAGLVRNEPWVEKSAERATRLVQVKELQVIAVLLASVAPTAIDYLEQAPVLVLAATNGASAYGIDNRKYIASRFLSLIHGGPRLRDVLEKKRIARTLRSVSGSAWRLRHYKLLADFRDVPPSVVAQSIPRSKETQRHWLESLAIWRDHLGRRGSPSEGIHHSLFAWAVVSLARSQRGALSDVTTVADFACTHPASFTSRWTWEKAANEAEAWHAELARASNEKQFMMRHGIGWTEPIDYGFLPITERVNEFTFSALRTGEELYLEGAAMHHCVCSYAKDVIRGGSRIYSIRRDERRVATVEIVSRPRVRITQIKGPCNALPAPNVQRAAHAFVELINRRIAGQIEQTGYAA